MPAFTGMMRFATLRRPTADARRPALLRDSRPQPRPRMQKSFRLTLKMTAAGNWCYPMTADTLSATVTICVRQLTLYTRVCRHALCSPPLHQAASKGCKM